MFLSRRGRLSEVAADPVVGETEGCMRILVLVNNGAMCNACNEGGERKDRCVSKTVSLSAIAGAVLLLVVAGCGGHNAGGQTTTRRTTPPDSVKTGESLLAIPDKSPAGVDAYWQQASQDAAAFELPLPPKESPRKGATAPEGSKQIVPPGKRAGTGVKPVRPTRGFGTPQSATTGSLGRPLSSTGGITSTEGKVFFDQAGKHWVCSGTVLNSPNQSVVWTAGHCVHEGAGGVFNSNWVFAPGYRDGQAPFGYWRPRGGSSMFTLKKWSQHGSLLYDLGAVVLERQNGRTVLDVVGGGQGITFNQNANKDFWAFGYPAAAPYDGQKLYYCHSGSIARDSPTVRTYRGKYSPATVQITGPARIGINCTMTGGSSGGGWLIGYDGSWGWADGVNSTGGNGTMWTPYLGGAAAQLWNYVKNY
jgi:hypothetical protein